METNLGLQKPVSGSLNGLIPVQNNAALDAAEDARQKAESANNEELVQNLASYVRKCWTAAREAKEQTVETRMVSALRQRRGEYEPEVLNEIRKFGGSEIFMMLTSNKCRSAGAWLRDNLTGTGSSKPWSLDPTKIPEILPSTDKSIAQKAAEEAFMLEQAMGMQITTEDQMKKFLDNVVDRRRAEVYIEAKKVTKRMEDKMEDQMQEGGFQQAMSDFIDDITTFPAAVLKGPVVRKKPRMKWIQGANKGEYTPEVKDTLVLEWERVDPFMVYPAPYASGVNDGYLIERHRLTRTSLNELIGVEGYDDDAIKAVLDDYSKNGYSEWLSIDTTKASAEGKSTTQSTNADDRIDAIQFWGTVQGKWLIEWGMDEEEVPEPTKEYNCELWLINKWVIKASLNFDPFGRKPYYKSSYEEIPGVFWGNSIPDLIRDCQVVCNNSARALVNNMGIASGPQAYINIDRLPPGEQISQMYPWKTWQVLSDQYGNSGKPIEFFQPTSLAQELMGVYNTFATLADEYSGIPRYMTGDSPTGGAGRTASGMSMLMNNAGKSMKQVVNNIDINILQPMVERLYYYNMKHSEDPELKGDVSIVPLGANAMIVKEGAQQRRNEFLQIIATNPTFTQIVGMNGIAALLREVAKTLDMDVDKIVPSDDAIKAMQFAQQQQQILAAGAAMQGGQPGQPAQSGPVSNPNQNLENGQPVTDNFSPMTRG